ncbi:hypothetical protein Q5425_27830 [Amycolatopsis sp. A133]|uniref:hypothetical protein n=1 Tax=Amycolatopsis sp. A133 TaxID=3064472 RepID=UPI0027E66CC9|nr:hypothetical protein [Amycolatopsis sp. A133]MDQ7807563.1 hypothetical protein [Amycolatopsis sp. A133]
MTDEEPGGFCPTCGVRLSFGRNGATELHVFGSHAEEVQAVTDHLSKALARREISRLRSPWFSGLFYLTAVVVITTLLLAVARILALWALPVVIIGAVLLISVVGALQLRADDRLSERNFVKLMGDVLRRLPLVFRRERPGGPEDQ